MLWSSMHVSPVGELTLSLMVVLYPFWPVNLIVAMPEDPVWNVIEVIGFIVKVGSVDVSQRLLSTIEKANAFWMFPYGDVVVVLDVIDMNMPYCWSNRKIVEA